MATEIDYKYNNKYDLGSLGVILYKLYTNKYIFYSENKEEENNRFKKRKRIKRLYLKYFK
jgi:hypothetical protein